MRLYSSLLRAVLSLTVASAAAWSIQQQQQPSLRSLAVSPPSFSTRLAVSIRPSSSSSSSTAASSSSSSARAGGDDSSSSSSHPLETASGGRILEGGKVIDFSAVKASSRAETALAAARQQVLSWQQQTNQQQEQQQEHSTLTDSTQTTAHTTPPSTAIQRQTQTLLGINDDVVKQVGHALATYCTAEEVQDCAAWIKSRAPPGFFTTTTSTSTNGSAADSSPTTTTTTTPPTSSTSLYTPEQVQRFKFILAQAYDESGQVTEAFAKTFYMGTMLLNSQARRAIWAVYVWCRRTDEIVDAPRDADENSNNGQNGMLPELSYWEMRLENLWSHGTVVDAFDLCLLDALVTYPTLDITPFMDMIRGMLMDVPDLGQEVYETFDELHLYCYRVAGTVGLMSLPVFGCAPGQTDETAREPALSLGVAFQLTNILRDVGEDAVQRGRIYLPREDLRRFGVTEEQIYAQCVDDNYINLMKFEIARARMYYERARRGVFMLAESSRLPVQSSLDAYGKILDKIEENGYDSLTKRAYVGKWEKLCIIPFSWYRTLDISRQFPLPGDEKVTLQV